MNTFKDLSYNDTILPCKFYDGMPCTCYEIFDKMKNKYPRIEWDIDNILKKNYEVHNEVHNEEYKVHILDIDLINNYCQNLRLIKAQYFILKWVENMDMEIDYSKPITENQIIKMRYWQDAMRCGYLKSVQFVNILQMNRCKENVYRLYHLLEKWHISRIDKNLETIEKMYFDENLFATKIQKQWRLCSCNPEYKLCRNRLKREYDELSNQYIPKEKNTFIKRMRSMTPLFNRWIPFSQ